MMRQAFKTKKTALATAVMTALLSGGVMATGFAAAVEGISYSGGVLTPDSSGHIQASDILERGGGATAASLTAVKAALEGRLKVTEDLLAGDWGGKTVQNAINVTAQAITDLETVETAAISALDLRMDAAESAIDSNINVIIPNIYKTIADLETTENGKIAGLDGRVTDAEKAIDNFVDTKANADMDNLTETGKTAVKDLAKGAINVVGDGPVSVAKSDVSGVDTYTVSVKTDGKVESGDTGIVTGGTVYTAIAAKADAADLSALEGRVTTNEGNIATNTANISTNTTNIASLDSRVTQNETDIFALEGRVTTNEGNIATNTADITKINDALYGDTIAIGKDSEATGTHSIAIGFGNKVSGNNSGAIGDPNTVEGDNSWAFGNNNQIPGSNSIVLGNKNNVSGSNTFVLGNNVTADVDNAVVLGDGSKAEADAVSVGSDGGERQIKHVKDGTDDTDAATVGQLKALAGGTGAGLEEVTHRIDNLDSKINKVGAGAAALAALHPLDTDNKFTMAAGFGNYRNANAMALGMFYRPTDKVMFSVGGAMGNGENMINAGVSFALDKGVGTSKAAMTRKIQSLEGTNAEQATEIQSLKAENAKLAERLAAIEAKLAK